MTDLIEPFTQAGQALERRWRSQGYRLEAFPELAEEAAATIPAPDMVALLEQHHDKLTRGSNHFSDFELHAFSNERFHIEVLHWLNGSTSIHQHGFCGAFKMLRGRTLNVHSVFDVGHQHNDTFMSGTLRYADSQVLRTGEVCRIDGGSDFIHASYHLGRPVVSLVVRTNSNKLFGAQYSYLPPHFAFDPFHGRHSAASLDRMLEVVAQIGQSGAFDEVLGRLLAKSTLEEAVQIVLHGRVVHGDAKRLARTLSVAADAHPAWRDEIAATAHEVRRQAAATTLRRQVKDIHQKFLLALVANLTQPEPILRHLGLEFPQEAPAQAAARLLHGVAQAGHLPAFASEGVPVLAEVISGRRPAVGSGLPAALFTHEVLQPLFGLVAHPSVAMPAAPMPAAPLPAEAVAA